ncbi:MAG: hypothetical protein NTY19_27255 [Planctomycetota bacterium]|nr:hypothetical protein [Planctomycetota bacterium]
MCSAVALSDLVHVEAVIVISDPVELLRLLSTPGLGVHRWHNPGEGRAQLTERHGSGGASDPAIIQGETAASRASADSSVLDATGVVATDSGK